MHKDLILEKEINEAIWRSNMTSAEVAPLLERMAKGQKWAADREAGIQMPTKYLRETKEYIEHENRIAMLELQVKQLQSQIGLLIEKFDSKSDYNNKKIDAEEYFASTLHRL